ncbi:MAG TPA: zinc-dependent metalloprotease [Candidatus Limnocylindrales bacterium]|nr:zinc-dependent metalloprotease [Candidatus Limnocylindrales bacterium]
MSRHTTRVGAGIIVGGLLAFGASVASREIMRRAGTRLIDWDAVREIAHRRLGEAGSPIPAAHRAEAEAFYRSTLLRIEPIVAEEIGSELPEALETPAVVDRLQWVDLNLSTFRLLLDRVERTLLESQVGPDTTGRAVSRWVNRKVGNQQLGFMLAFLGRKVLGQYDVSLLAAAPTRGRLHFVEPNIVATAATLRVPRDEFRTFIALHEATHAFEFEAHEWLRPYFAGLVAETVEQLAAESGGLMERFREALSGGEGHWLERIMTPRQRDTFNRTQALMSLLEGYSNHVMNAAGARILPNFRDIHERFERRGERRGALERAIMRVTGLDLKMEQYAAGERFADAVIERRGREFLNRVWSGPELLPSLDEIRQPDRWIARVEGGAS